MSATPRSYPLLARLRYAYFEAGRELPVVENAWWESRWDGGRVLGAVVEAMDHPRTPHRLRVHLRLSPQDTPVEMKLSLMRPEEQGEATYAFEPDRVLAEGEWDGEAFRHETPMTSGYTVAPYCIAADGLHFLRQQSGNTAGECVCYMVNPRSGDSPLIGQAVPFHVSYGTEEPVEVQGRSVPARRFTAAYTEGDAPPAEYWVTANGYPLRMRSQRRSGEPVEVVCIRLTGDF